MTTPAAITVPRLPDESARAYEARLRDVTLGPQRSLDAVAQQSAKSLPLMKRWSERHGWVESARRYDEAVAYLTVQEASQQYRRDLEAHRADAMRYGQALCGVAVEMLTQLRAEARRIEYSPAALATIARALTTGLDLRAHALDLDKLLPTLTTQGGGDE